MIDPRVTGFPGDDRQRRDGRGPAAGDDRTADRRLRRRGRRHTPSTCPAPGIANVADSRDFSDGEVAADALQSADATVFAELGIAVVSADAAQMGALQAGIASGRRVLSVSPELIHHVLRESVLEYAQAYRDGVADLADHLMHTNGHGMPALPGRPHPADLRRHPAGDVGHPGGPGDLVAAVGQGHPGRRPGHRVRHRRTPTSPAAT